MTKLNTAAQFWVQADHVVKGVDRYLVGVVILVNFLLVHWHRDQDVPPFLPLVLPTDATNHPPKNCESWGFVLTTFW